MQDASQNVSAVSGWALPVSVATHLAAIALLIFGLPQWHSTPPQEEAIPVQLVPPPEPPKKPEPAPAQAAKPPPPQPAPEPQKQPEQKIPPAGSAEAVKAPLPVMQPVVEFGEKDSGPKKSLDGDSSESGAEAPTGEVEEAPKPKAPEPLTVDKSTGGPHIAVVEDPKPSKAKPTENAAKTSQNPKLANARKLFSRSLTDDPVARTAIGKIPRDRRGGMLCGTELRQQLVNGSPPHFPDILPSVLLTSGVVIDVKAAFRAAGQWRAVNYRCTVDADAMKVVSFAMSVGELIPRSEWRRMGLVLQ